MGHKKFIILIPDVCPLRGTFFVKHDYNNYHNVETLYSMGNEIAVSAVSGNDLQVNNDG